MNFEKWIGAVAFLISLYILWRIRQVLLLLLVAVILAMVLNRLVRWLQRFGIHHSLAIALSVVTFLIIFSSFVVGVIPPFIEQLQRFILLLPETLEEVQQGVERLQAQIPGEWPEDFQLLELLQNQGQQLIEQQVNDVFIWVSDLLAIVLKLVFIFVLSVMLLSNPQQYRQPFIRLFPAFYRSRIDEILTQCEADLVSWVTGTLITMATVTILSGLGLWILRIPLGLANALWAGFCEIIPNISYIIAMLPPLAIALLEAPWKALPVIGLYFLIQQLESYVIVPWVMKQQVSLPPAMTLLSQVIFATLFGVIGLFLALPLMIVTKIWLREVLIKDLFDRWQTAKD
ncbi:MAG: AI-2E family transporter [Elainellaceae cyanobacterium]